MDQEAAAQKRVMELEGHVQELRLQLSSSAAVAGAQKAELETTLGQAVAARDQAARLEANMNMLTSKLGSAEAKLEETEAKLTTIEHDAIEKGKRVTELESTNKKLLTGFEAKIT